MENVQNQPEGNISGVLMGTVDFEMCGQLGASIQEILGIGMGSRVLPSANMIYILVSATITMVFVSQLTMRLFRSKLTPSDQAGFVLVQLST